MFSCFFAQCNKPSIPNISQRFCLRNIYAHFQSAGSVGEEIEKQMWSMLAIPTIRMALTYKRNNMEEELLTHGHDLVKSL